MTNTPNMELFDDLVTKAASTAIELNEKQVTPFNLLEVLVNDESAKEMCEAVEFPFEKLRKIVNENLVNYIPPENAASSESGKITLSSDFASVLQEALNLTVEYDQSDIGYIGLLKALRDEGGEFCAAALSDTLLDITDEDFDQFLEGEQILQTPRKKLTKSFYDAVNDNGKVLEMAETLKQRIIGQDKAVETLAQSMKRAFAGLKEANKPVGSYLFAGPTGVGKTEIAQQLSEFLDIELVRIDMSEYMEPHSVSRLLGSPPGYIGSDEEGIFMQTIGEHGACVLLLDEIEKAHPQINNVLLQIMDNAAITDTHGNTIDFSNVVLIMTTNEGVTDISKPTMGFNETSNADQSANYNAAINKRFTPEFRNRLDKIVTFDHLEQEHLTEIAKIFVKELNKLPAAEGRNLSFSATPSAIKAMVKKSYDKTMGARPIKRFMNDSAKDLMADKILTEDIRDKKLVIAYSEKKGGFRIDEKPLPKGKQPKQEPAISENVAPEPANM